MVGSQPEFDRSQSIIEEAFGFRPTIYVWFRLAPKEEREKGSRTLMRVTIELLRQISGDAVLLFNGESIVLQRLGGQLLLNEEFSSWITFVLPEVTLQYEIRNLPSPLL